MITAPYGSWKSPITTDLIVAESVNLKEIALAGNDVYWIEQRPCDAGRSVIVCNGVDITPREFSARSRAHEYGGGSYLVAAGEVIFSNDSDQRLYRGSTPVTRATGVRFADGVFDHKNNRIICVREDHRVGGEPINTLVAFPLAGTDAGEVLQAGHDFYSSPKLSPDGNHLAWLTWDHPNMPWDETQLWLDGQRIAGGASIFQPEWSPDGVLHFVSDRNNWWNLYRLRAGKIEHVIDKPVEFGTAQWVFGLSTYAFLDDGRIVCSYNDRGTWRLALFDGKLRTFMLPHTEISQVRAAGHHVVFRGATPDQPAAIVRLDVNTGQTEVLRRSTNVTLDPHYISTAVSLDTAFYYPPTNPVYAGLPGEWPPLIVMSHGGPTSTTTSGLDLKTQFWTSRGFAVVDVNYGGSTGFGRVYRQRLNGQWGIVDVDDCCAAARYLVERKLADPNRLIIRGGSAGGYTTLCALTFRDVFKAGASYYGISDLEWSNETHKFESRYNYSLVAPWPAAKEIYHARSPLRHADRLNCPIIFFQGLDDKIVLPNQSQLMVAAMKRKGLPVEYLEFDGEGHGFRQAATIQRALEAELAFYLRIFSNSAGSVVGNRQT